MNKHYINQQKMLHKEIESLVPAVYASIAMMLYDSGVPHEDIEYIFAGSQKIWEDHASDVTGLLVKCFNQTGIQLMSQKQYDWAKKKGLINED